MNFLNIKYFIAIAEERSISAAARKLYVSQQSLSEHLKKMEDELGAPLFYRESPLTLTLAGQCFLEDGKKLLNEYNQMIADINDLTSTRSSRLSLGISTYSEPPFLLDFLCKFHEKYPQYEVSVIKRWHTDILQNMRYVDLYFSYLPLKEGLEIIPLIEDDPYCVTFRRSLAEKTFGGRWPSIEAELIETQDLALLSDMSFLLLYDRHNQLAEDLADIFDEYQFTPKAGFTSENGDLLDQMCPHGDGVLLRTTDYVKRRFPDMIQNEGTASQSGELLSYPIKVTSFKPMLALCYESGRHFHAVERCFIQEAQEYFTKN